MKRAEARVDLGRVADLVFRLTHASRAVYCAKAGGARGSCVVVDIECSDDNCDRKRVNVELYGPQGVKALEELAGRLEEAARLGAEWRGKVEEFEAGRATLEDVLGASRAFTNTVKRLKEDLARSAAEFAEAMGLHPSSFYNGDDARRRVDVCQRLINAINDVVRHPEPDEW